MMCAGGAVAQAALAQEAPETTPTATQDQTDGEARLNTVVITGSRVARTGLDSPTPLAIMTNETIKDLGQVNVSETLRLIPQNSANQSDASAGIQNNPNVGASYANLRGLNPANGTRTLTLVNSRRFVPTSDGGAVDVNVVPASMIDRVEIVTGGASAAYGSDAVAGVVNIILDTDMEGWKAELDYGQTFRGDGETKHGALAWGGSFAEGRGHLVIGGEFQNQDGIGDCAEEREWCAESWDIFDNVSNVLPDGTLSGYDIPGSPGYGLPNYILGPGSKQAYNDPNGVVRYRNPAPIAARNKVFTDDGTGIMDFDPGNYVSNLAFGTRQGGGGDSTFGDSDLQTPIDRYVGYAYGEFELTDAVELYGELTFANREASTTTVTSGPRSTYYVFADNAFLPAELVELLDGSPFSLMKDLDEQVPNYNIAETEVFRSLAGLRGEFGETWSWDTYFQYGTNTREQVATRSRFNPAYVFAQDAVVDPDTGNIVCRELLSDDPDPLAEGCVPLNMFGYNNLDPAAVDYVWRPVPESFEFTQYVLSGSMTGELHDGWGAGPIGTAFGFDYRTEEGDVSHGDLDNYTQYAFTFGLDYAGEIEVIEGFGEINVPVFRDSALGESLELNAGLRYTENTSEDTIFNQSKSSDAVSWKISGIYDIVDGVRLRGSRSRDIRAAGFRELFLKNVPTDPASAQGRVDNPNIPGSPLSGDDPTPILTGGSFSLSPEESDTTTLGIVLEPNFIPGLQVSVDWFQIDIADAITTLDGQRIVDFCFEFDAFCDRITFAAEDDITFVDATQVNLGQFKTSGFDIDVNYVIDLEDMFEWGRGDLGLRAFGTNQYEFLVRPNPTLPEQDFAGQTGPVPNTGDFSPTPDWVWNFIASYSRGGFKTSVAVNYVSEGILDATLIGPDDPSYDPSLPNSININTVDSATYTTLAMSYDMSVAGDGSLEVFGVINNLFDVKPPVAPGGGGIGGSDYPTNPAYFDTFGARFRMGVRASF